jgi:uncharacterized membrane protein
LLAFSEWLAATSLSTRVQNLLWLIPTLQTFHIIALAILFTSVGAVALRSFGRLGTEASPALVARRFQPWVWGALAVLLATGSVLIIGEPQREFINWAFWIKMPLIVIAALGTALQFSFLAHSEGTDPAVLQARGRLVAVALVALWVLVVIFGRLIAYAQII